MNCRFCGKQFNRTFNLRRHENDYCALSHQDQEMSKADSSEMNYSEEDMSSGDESMTTSDNESETEDSVDPWQPMINEAKERRESEFDEIKDHLINTGLDAETATDEATSTLLPKLQKDLEDIYVERLMWMHEMKKDPVHRKIMQTKREFMENDDFDPQEALEAAIDKRKFLIRRH